MTSLDFSVRVRAGAEPELTRSALCESICSATQERQLQQPLQTDAIIAAHDCKTSAIQCRGVERYAFLSYLVTLAKDCRQFSTT